MSVYPSPPNVCNNELPPCLSKCFSFCLQDFAQFWESVATQKTQCLHLQAETKNYTSTIYFKNEITLKCLPFQINVHLISLWFRIILKFVFFVKYIYIYPGVITQCCWELLKNPINNTGDTYFKTVYRCYLSVRFEWIQSIHTFKQAYKNSSKV